MLRTILDSVNGMVAWFNRRRRIPSGGEMRVNLGSALTVAPGWLNVDGSLNALFARAPALVLRQLYLWSGSRQQYTSEDYCRILRTNRFIHHDFRHGLPFKENSVDCVYSSHLLEHLFRDDALRLLREIHRVLKPGGWVRICVPDLAYALSLLAGNGKERALDYFFASSAAGRLNRHQYMYDFDLLDAALRRSGFARPVRRSFQQGEVPDLSILDNRAEETLYVEAQKTDTVAGNTTIHPY